MTLKCFDNMPQQHEAATRMSVRDYAIHLGYQVHHLSSCSFSLFRSQNDHLIQQSPLAYTQAKHT